MVLDRSGSMARIKPDTEGGFNEMVAELRKEAAPNTYVTLVQFDTVHETVYEQKPLDKVPSLTLLPRSGTALLDGVGIAIRRAEKFVRSGDNVAVTIMTDGGENSSDEWDKESVTKLMDEKREEGWEFNFLGAGPQAWDGARLLGIRNDYVINYAGDGDSQHSAFQAAALSNVAKTRGLSSSYASSATALKADLESAAGSNVLPDVQINIGARPRRRGSGKNLK